MRDAYANWRTVGGDNLVAAISSGPISDVTALQVIDNTNGSFTVINRLTRSGEYTVSLGLESFENDLPFSPIFIKRSVIAALLPARKASLPCSCSVFTWASVNPVADAFFHKLSASPLCAKNSAANFFCSTSLKPVLAISS